MTDESLAPFHRNRGRLPRKPRQHESSSKTNRQLVKRNPPSSSGGTDLRISTPNTFTRNGRLNATATCHYVMPPESVPVSLSSQRNSSPVLSYPEGMASLMQTLRNPCICEYAWHQPNQWQFGLPDGLSASAEPLEAHFSDVKLASQRINSVHQKSALLKNSPFAPPRLGLTISGRQAVQPMSGTTQSRQSGLREDETATVPCGSGIHSKAGSPDSAQFTTSSSNTSTSTSSPTPSSCSAYPSRRIKRGNQSQSKRRQKNEEDEDEEAIEKVVGVIELFTSKDSLPSRFRQPKALILWPDGTAAGSPVPARFDRRLTRLPRQPAGQDELTCEAFDPTIKKEAALDRSVNRRALSYKCS
ncbi:unnamed protein product [Protopolystoma xenopodis]|uniref:Uncharacterized protein n=1 Tax=Protopolystoma xenopodis TaxID=117903 RepID=A0A448WJY8_9PLAT|nr:unnamed protein product [Protopolystoma xenopodis]